MEETNEVVVPVEEVVVESPVTEEIESEEDVEVV